MSPPLRIVGLADNGANLMTSFGQGFDETGRIGAGADAFRRIVEAEQQDLHAATLRDNSVRYH